METIWKFLLISFICFTLCSQSAASKKCEYRPRYHINPIKGWLNDPNGFCVFNNSYYLFYQHNPESALEPGIARWRCVKSKNLLHWVDEGIALQNDKEYDKTGVFSGSAVVDSGVLYLFYTGNVNLTGETPDHRQTQELAFSTDAHHFEKYEYNPIIKAENLQPDIRDPKVWKHGNSWYMILGNSFYDDNGRKLGRVILFKSSNKINWKKVTVLAQSDGFLGYMWECPDFFEIDGRFVLLFSPQGVKAQGDRYKNLYAVGYITGHFSYANHIFKPITEFRELDHGHDFYATQTILDNKGRRLLVAWMDMWKTSYPESEEDFKGQMILIRSLSLTKDNRLIQKPVEETASARGKVLFEGKSCKETTVYLPNKAGEVFIIAPGTRDFTLYIGSDSSCKYVQIKYEYDEGRVSLKRDNGDDGLRRTEYRPSEKLIIRVFIDASSLEVFLGDGEVTFSSRFFIDGIINVRLGDNSIADVFKVYEMKTTVYLDENPCV